jgi:phage terminase large subunit
MSLWRYLENGGRRAVAVWHRRAGKDSTALNWTAPAAHERVGVYWHMLPTQAQGRKTIWDGIDRAGRRMIDQAFPAALRSSVNKQEMKIELKCGSIWQVVGSDNYNSLIGANPVGVVFSEYSVADPSAWDYIRPILAENGGWAIFIYTARGRNHGATLHDIAKENAGWFAQILTVDDTGIIGPDVIAEERASGMSEDMIAQEYYCSFQAAIVGAYYGAQMTQADADDRIRHVPYEPNLLVETWWDLGVGDSTSIWFVQRSGREIRVIDYYEASGQGLPHYARVLQDRGYVYGRHIAPHDIEVRELGTGASRLETARGLGIRFEVAPKLPVDDGIDAVRAMLPRCWFEKTKAARLVEALRQYRKTWDDKNKVFQDVPHHDWTSHAADAGRYGAVSGDPPSAKPKMKPFVPIYPQSRPGAWMGR